MNVNVQQLCGALYTALYGKTVESRFDATIHAAEMEEKMDAKDIAFAHHYVRSCVVVQEMAA